MKKPVASIFIAILAVAAGASAQDAKNPPGPQLVSHQPATIPPQGVPAGNAQASTQPRTARDSAQLTPAERERVERQGGQPLLWLKTMAAAQQAQQANQPNQVNRKPQTSASDKKSQAKSR
jgi:hypothetical protein